MKLLLLLTFLLVGAVGYSAYSIHNDAIATQAEDQAKINALSAQVAELQTEAIRASYDHTSTAFLFPSTITTAGGKTYKDCKLDRANPDGISFYHSTGVSKIPYNELPSALSAAFGYDPKAAAQYAADESIRERQSDALRSSSEAAVAASLVQTSPTPSTQTPAVPNPTTPSPTPTDTPPSSPSPAPDPTSPSPNPVIDTGGGSQKSHAQIAAIRASIASLQHDIDSKTTMMQTENASSTSQAASADSSYAEAIRADQAQIDALKAQLSGN